MSQCLDCAEQFASRIRWAEVKKHARDFAFWVNDKGAQYDYLVYKMRLTIGPILFCYLQSFICKKGKGQTLLINESLVGGNIVAADAKENCVQFLELAQISLKVVQIGGALFAEIYRSEERRVGKECRSRWLP